MALSYVGGCSAVTADGTSPVLDLTTLSGGSGGSPLTDDIVIIATGFSSATNGDPGVSTAGYTELADLYANDTQDSNLSVSYKVMGGTPDTSATCNGSLSADYGSTAVCQVWRGVDATTPIDVTTVTTGGIDTGVPNPASITPVTSGAVVIIAGAGTAAADVTPTAPAGFSNLVENCASAAVLFSPVALASMAWTSGAVDAAAFGGFVTGAARSWNAVSLVLRPAPAGNNINCTLGTADASGYTANVDKQLTIAATLGTATASGYTATVDQQRIISGILAEATAEGYLAEVTPATVINCVLGSATASGYTTATNFCDTLTTIANSTYEFACGLGFQSHLLFNGVKWSAYYYPGTGTSVKFKVAHAIVEDGVFGTAQALPSAQHTGIRGYQYTVAQQPILYHYQSILTSTGYLAPVIPSNVDLAVTNSAIWIYGAAANSLAQITFPTSPVAIDYNWPNSVTDFAGRLWVLSTTDVMTKVLARVFPWADHTSSTATELATGLSGSSATRLAALPNSDMGAIYTSTGNIYCRVYDDSATTWIAAETITTTSSSYQIFTASGANDGTLAVFWCDSTTTSTIKCKVRGSDGTWGSVFDFATDRSTDADICSCHNLGATSQILVYYKDTSGDLVFRTLNSGTAGAKTQLVAQLPTLIVGWIQCLQYSIGTFGCKYHESASGDIKLATHTIAAVPISSDGTLVSSNGFKYFGTFNFEQHIVDYDSYSFVTWNDMGGRTLANVWDAVNSVWLYEETLMHPNPHWDAHNMATCTISSDGYVVLAKDGRYYALTEVDAYDHLIVLKSDYPLGHASFSLTAFTDISPSTTGITEGRGYKYAQFDNNGILHLATCHANRTVMRNYNGSTWSAYADGLVFDFDTTGSANQTYIDRMLLGKETSGQQSLNFSLGYFDAGGGYGSGHRRAFFVRLIYQPGTRTYLCYDIQGNSVTLPLDETYGAGNAVYFDMATANELRRFRQGFTMLSDNTPVFAYAVEDKTTHAFKATRSTRWTGSAWSEVSLTATESACDACFQLSDGTIYAMVKLQDGSSVWQLNHSTSSDSGATWSGFTARTTASKNYREFSASVDDAIVYLCDATGMSGEVRMLPREVTGGWLNRNYWWERLSREV